jgi:hypothetical protein
MRCPVCEATGAEVFHEQRDALVFCNRPASSRTQALAAPRADIRLAICRRCTHVFNTAFDPAHAHYGAGYENSLHFSDTFGAYEHSLAEGLIERFDLRGKHIVDLGCGDGSFLRLLCTLGDNRGTGFDPAAPRGDGKVELVAAPYSVAHARMRADFVSCRHVLEHLDEPRTFLDGLKPLLRAKAASYYFEVPNGVMTFCDRFVWDVLYEHRSYFSPRSLQALFDYTDLGPIETRPAFGEQFLAVYGQTAAPASVEPAAQSRSLHEDVRTFARRWAAEVEAWRSRLADFERRRRSVAIWGAGTKGVTFLDAVGSAGAVAAVVDVNPRKHGTWIAGCGLQVSSPAALRRIRPQVVIVMNPIYVPEVRAGLNALGLAPEIVAVADPSV